MLVRLSKVVKHCSVASSSFSMASSIDHYYLHSCSSGRYISIVDFGTHAHRWPLPVSASRATGTPALQRSQTHDAVGCVAASFSLIRAWPKAEAWWFSAAPCHEKNTPQHFICLARSPKMCGTCGRMNTRWWEFLFLVLFGLCTATRERRHHTSSPEHTCTIRSSQAPPKLACLPA